MLEGVHKARGGLIRAFVGLEGNRITKLILSGDFILSPEHFIEKLETSLLGVEPRRDSVLAKIKEFYSGNLFQSPGTSAEDFAEAILKAVESGKT